LTNLYNDEVIEIVKVTAKAKSDSTITATWYFGTEYRAASAIYSGSPEVFPLLVEAPRTNRSLGRFHGQQASVNINLFNIPFKSSDSITTGKNLTINNQRDVFTFHGADVQILAYLKPSDALTTHSDSVNIRQTLELIDSDLDSETDILTIRCFESWLKNNPLNTTLTTDRFANLLDKHKGKFGSIPFSDADIGEEAIIDIIPITESTTAGSGFQTTATYYTGWQDSLDAPVGSLETIYARNRNKEFDSNEWIETSLPNVDDIFFVTDTESWFNIPTGSFAMSGFEKASVDASRTSVGDSGIIITHCALAVRMEDDGAPRDDVIGSLKVECYNTELITASGLVNEFTFQPRGRLLSSAEFQLTDALWANGTGSTTMLLAPFSPFIAVGDDSGVDDYSSLIFEASWSNKTGGQYPLLTYDDEAGFVHYEKDLAKGDEPGWNSVLDKRIGMEVFLAHNTTSGSFDNTTFEDYTTYAMQTIDAYGGVTPDKESRPFSSLDLKAGMFGLRDVNGKYGATVSGYITNPAVIINFLLTNSGIGLGLPEDSVESASAESLLGVEYNMTFAVDRNQPVKALVQDIGKQGVVSINTNREGVKVLTRPQWRGNASPDYVFSQAEMKGDLRVLKLDNLPHSQVINAIEIQFNENELGSPEDEEENRYFGKIILNADETSENDFIRQRQAQESEALYDRREFRATFNYYIDRGKAVLAASYYFDRFHEVQQELTFVIPRTEANLAIDLYDYVRVVHKDIPHQDGTTDRNNTIEDYTPALVYEDGTLCEQTAHGSFIGMVVKLQESGSSITVTAQTATPFRWQRP